MFDLTKLWCFTGMLRSENESLFTYASPFLFSYFNNHSVKPATFITDTRNVTAHLDNHCSGTVTEKDLNDTCRNNTACIVDTALTCNITFGAQTVQTQVTNTENADITGTLISHI